MTKTTRAIRYTMAAGLAALVLGTGRVAAAEPVPHMNDVSEQNSLQITLGLADESERVTVGDTAVVTFAGRIALSAMVYAFRVEVVDAAGISIQGGASWHMIVFTGTPSVGGTRLRALVRLSDSSHEIALPKPLGFRLDATDSLLVVATIHETPSQAQYLLRLTVEYEPLTVPHSRLAVLPLGELAWNSARIISGSNTATQSWEWTADLSGRLLAIAGLPLDRVAELMLQDVETGAVLWSAVVTGRRAVLGQRGQAIRFGVPVQEGRRYRLTTAYRHSGVDALDGATALAVVLPSRG